MADLYKRIKQLEVLRTLISDVYTLFVGVFISFAICANFCIDGIRSTWYYDTDIAVFWNKMEDRCMDYSKKFLEQSGEDMAMTKSFEQQNNMQNVWNLEIGRAHV